MKELYKKDCLFFESSGKFVINQSGFRENRSTTDNLLFLTQKVRESFNKKNKKVCCLTFDIRKAFDNVWHGGLLNKLINEKVPVYLIKWVADFLRDRNFLINLNNTKSEI